MLRSWSDNFIVLSLLFQLGYMWGSPLFQDRSDFRQETVSSPLLNLLYIPSNQPSLSCSVRGGIYQSDWNFSLIQISMLGKIYRIFQVSFLHFSLHAFSFYWYDSNSYPDPCHLCFRLGVGHEHLCTGRISVHLVFTINLIEVLIGNLHSTSAILKSYLSV